VTLKKPDGTYISSQTELESLATNFCTNIFNAQDQTTPEIITQFIQPKVSDIMNERSPVTDTDIENALFMMHPNKSPGSDGFMAGFYIQHWNVLKNDICSAVSGFTEGGQMPEVVNNTILVLILKVKQPQDLTQYRPIALCNVLYKIVSKILALRLRPILDELISEEQSTFVPDRLITDNVITALSAYTI
jgi:hypothetical protein